MQIWGNIQPSLPLNKLNLNSDDTSCWKPFFGPGFAKVPHLSIQSPSLDFKEPSSKWVLSLEALIEKNIVNTFEEWRQGNVTRWNR